MEFDTPLINSIGLDKSHELHLADLEVHGLSPTSLLSSITIESLAHDLGGLFVVARLSSSSGKPLIAHSMGCLVALKFTIKHLEQVKNLALLGPSPNPLPDSAVGLFTDRAALVRKKGMVALVDTLAASATSAYSQTTTGLTAVGISLLATEPEAYAKACTVLAGNLTARGVS